MKHLFEVSIVPPCYEYFVEEDGRVRFAGPRRVAPTYRGGSGGVQGDVGTAWVYKPTPIPASWTATRQLRDSDEMRAAFSQAAKLGAT